MDCRNGICKTKTKPDRGMYRAANSNPSKPQRWRRKRKREAAAHPTSSIDSPESSDGDSLSLVRGL